MKFKQIICLLLVVLFVQSPVIAARGDDDSVDEQEQSPINTLSGGSSTSCGIDYGDQPSDIISLRSLLKRKIQTESLISQILLGREDVETICGLSEKELTQIRMHNVDLALEAERVYRINGDLIISDGDIIEERVGEVSSILFAIDRRMKDLDEKRTRNKKGKNKKKKNKNRDSLKVIQEKDQLRLYKAELLYALNFWIIVRDWYHIEIIKKIAEENSESGGVQPDSNNSGQKVIPLGFGSSKSKPIVRKVNFKI